MAEWDDDVDGLYGLEPKEFVAARNALAKRMRAAGDKSRAAEVAGLGRPTLVAWALNRTVRDDPGRVAALIDAAERQAIAQDDLMAGGDAAELRSATSERRAAAGEIVRSAAGLAGATHADAVRTTLDAALADPDLLERLRTGTLSDTLDAPAGFGFGLDAEPGAPAAPPRPRRSPRVRGAAAAAVRAAPDPGPDPQEEAREKARADAAAEVARLETDVAAATTTVDAASTDLEEADDEVREAEDALTAARLARGQAADAFSAARDEHDRTVALLEEARRLLSVLDDDRRD